MRNLQLDEEAIFQAARRISSGKARVEYLAHACGDDDELRCRVEQLLHVHDEEQSFLEPPRNVDPTIDLPGQITAGPGTVIGPYKLREKIGEGGFGVVYVAEQTEPVRRKVALKIIKPGMDTREIIARFEAERQALAMMEHPNIARVLDAGTMGEYEPRPLGSGLPDPVAHAPGSPGRPYFVMELVKGIPITEFCDAQKLSTRERLELFVQVCRAVQHAHQKGIIHRDIKPSNVMVTLSDTTPVPKVIDFGVAKALSSKLTEKTVYTAYGQMVGTPLYMSPEQAQLSGIDVDTRSDIYSLGVLLYELLTGTTPFDKETLQKSGFDEMRRIIREVDPPRPSARISTLKAEALSTLPSPSSERRGLSPPSEAGGKASTRRRNDARKLSHSLRGELDWIVMKALDKDRNRRYETANGLARDIERYLHDEPVHARPPSAAYRFRKFARRNKGMLTAAAIVGMALILGIVGTLWQALRATRAERDRLDELQIRIAKEATLNIERNAREEWIPRIESLLEDEKRVPAFQLAQRAKQAIPNDPEMADLWDRLSASVTIVTDPPGADAFIKDWRHLDDRWVSIGRTPLHEAVLPRGPVRFQFRKEGYVLLENVALLLDQQTYDCRLRRQGEDPQRMVYVPGAKSSRFTKRTVAVGPFLIDTYEVSNRDFQQFVDADGYENRSYWKQEFVKNGEKLTWDEAVAEFRDRTGRPGPATWSHGRYPDGEGDYPVRGVSWYEAAAYAKFAGKSLPSVHHWTAAAYQFLLVPYVVPLSNFSNKGPASSGTYRGVGSFGAYDLAGNVKEWAFNATEEGNRWILGGAWNEPTYMFGLHDSAPPFSRLETYGFRCVRYLEQPSSDAFDATKLNIRDYSLETPATAEEVKAYLRLYMYDAKLPLQPQMVSVDDAAEGYRHEIVQINAAYGNERINLHLFLPKKASPPYQAVVYFPGAGARQTKRPTGNALRIAVELAQRGRLVCWPVYQGTFERRDGYTGAYSPIKYRTFNIQLAQDLARSIDYLESRADIDTKKLAFVGFSWGAQLGPLMAVVEPRLDTCILISGGLSPSGGGPPEVNPFNFLPHVKVPTLMINGRYDDHFRLKELQMPMFEGLGSTQKEIIHFDTSHVVPLEETMQHTHDWLNKYLGPVTPNTD